MSTTDIDPMALIIAKKLNTIRSAEREKIVLQNKLDTLLEEVDAVKERLNRIDSVVTGTKYEINNCMNEATALGVVTNSEK
jgi:peptidoglycan hydrolase CwlO-like protein